MPIVPRRGKATDRTRQPHPGVTAMLAKAAGQLQAGEVCRIGSDGAAQGRSWEERCGAWAVATRCGTQGLIAVGDGLPGLDQSAPTAEAWGVLNVVEAAVAARVQHKVVIVCDNLAVVRRAQARLKGRQRVERFAPTLWSRFDAAARRLKELEVWWVPSHGKYMDSWSPPEGASGEEWRALNNSADEEASAHAERVWAAEGAWRQNKVGAGTWAQEALLRIWSAGLWLSSKYVSVRGNRFGRFGGTGGTAAV